MRVAVTEHRCASHTRYLPGHALYLREHTIFLDGHTVFRDEKAPAPAEHASSKKENRSEVPSPVDEIIARLIETKGFRISVIAPLRLGA